MAGSHAGNSTVIRQGIVALVLVGTGLSEPGVPVADGEGWGVEADEQTGGGSNTGAVASEVLTASIPLCGGVAQQVLVWSSLSGCELPEPGVCTYGAGEAGILFGDIVRASEDDEWQHAGYRCGPLPEGAVVITPAMVFEAFAHIGLPESVIQIQPVGGETLVNFDTNFYTSADPFTESVTLLGQTVELEIVASSFAWHFGDGASLTTTTPGAAYPDLLVTHAYTRTGEVTPSVNTTWSARYRVNGGAWLDVPDTVTMTGATEALLVREATPVLVD